MTPVLSVVIPTRNRRAALERLLAALGKQTVGPEQFEVIVVVDGSEDESNDLLESYRPPYRLHAVFQPHRGRAGAVNAGAEVAAGELIVLLDDDLVPEPEFLAAHLRAHTGDRRLGAVGAVHFQLDGGAPPFAHFWGNRFDHFLGQVKARGNHVLDWSETYTGAFSVRRADMLAVGGFDDRFDGYGLEDFDFALRLVRSGVELELLPEAVAHHDFVRSFAEGARNAESRGRSAVLFGRLHPDIRHSQFDPKDAAPPTFQRRLFRGLPRLSEALPFLPGAVVRFTERAERRGSRHLELTYTLGLEYFYFLGVHRASRDRKMTARLDGEARGTGSEIRRSAAATARRIPGATTAGIRLLGMLQRIVDTGLTPSQRWRKHLPSEAGYWERVIESPYRFQETFGWCLDPDLEVLQGELRAAIEAVPRDPVLVIDVGAGPVTVVGRRCAGKSVEVTAVDPLADEYNEELRQAGLRVPVATRRMSAEELPEHFRPGSFDIAYAHNAIDHTADPMQVLEVLLSLVRDDGFVVLRSLPNEGERNSYFGIHQWNVEYADGDAVIWNRAERHALAQALAGRAEVTVNTQGEWITATIRPLRG